MKKRAILKTIELEKEYNKCLRKTIMLSGSMESEIIIKITSLNRKYLGYEFTYNSDTREIEYENDSMYGGGLPTKINKHIEEVFSNLEIEISKEDMSTIMTAIDVGFKKADSRYGIAVSDYGKYGCDALIIINAEDNGKPKHKVSFYNHGWYEDNVEDYDIGDLKGRFEYVVENDVKVVNWYIEKDSITFENLLIHLMGEFDNPYLVIEPTEKMNIILDFKLNTDTFVVRS